MGFEIINRLKQEKGLTNAQISALSGVTLSTLDKITSGANTNPKLGTLQAICSVLGCTLNDFVDTPATTSATDTITPSERDHIKKYRTLDEYGKEAVDSVLYVEYKRCMSASDNAPSLAFAARRSDESHAIIGPDTDVEI